MCLLWKKFVDDYLVEHILMISHGIMVENYVKRKKK